MKRISILSEILIVWIASAFSQNRGWTMEDCMKYAVKNSPKVKSQYAQNDIYMQNYREAVGKLLPSVSANTYAYFNFGRGVDASTNTYANINSFSNNYSIYSSLTLFDGLYSINRIKMQKMNRLMGKADLRKLKDDVAYATMASFFDLIYQKKLVNLYESQLEESMLNYKKAGEMEKVGLKGIPDVSETEAKVAEDEFNLTKQKNIAEISLIKLKENMNFPLDSTLSVSDSIENILVSKTDENASEIYYRAKNYLPQALSAMYSVESGKMGYKASKGNFYPSLYAETGYSSNFFRYMDGSPYESFHDQLKNKQGHYFEISITFPIFSGFSNSAEMKRNKASVVMQESEREQTLRTIYGEIEQAVADMNGAAEEYYQARKQRESMEIANKLNEEKFREGTLSPIELYTSSNRLMKAKADELNAVLKFGLQYRLVQYYKGVSFIK